MNRSFLIFCLTMFFALQGAAETVICPKISVMKQFIFEKQREGLDTYRTLDNAVVLVVSCNEKMNSSVEKVVASLKPMGTVTRMNPDEFMLEIKKPNLISRTYYKAGPHLVQFAFSTKAEDVGKLQEMHSRILKDIRDLKPM